MSEKALVERLGTYSNEMFDRVAKKIEYKNLGVFFYLTKKKIYMLGVKDFGSGSPKG